jgi:hypothetical protein
MKGRRIAGIAGALVLFAGLAACGGDDDGDLGDVPRTDTAPDVTDTDIPDATTTVDVLPETEGETGTSE